MINNITFTGYNSVLKSEWRKGKLPTVRKGFYGDTLTQYNVSLEHLKPHCQGGKTELNNLVLASMEKNNARGIDNIAEHTNKETVVDYLLQFIGVKTKKFDGNKYIDGIITTLKGLNLDITI